MMTGDFPPNSNVTEPRCWAAAVITNLPTAALPVKKICSNGSASRELASVAPPSTTAASAGVKASDTIRLMSAAWRGVISEGLMMAGQPAASAEIRGPKVNRKG